MAAAPVQQTAQRLELTSSRNESASLRHINFGDHSKTKTPSPVRKAFLKQQCRHPLLFLRSSQRGPVAISLRTAAIVSLLWSLLQRRAVTHPLHQVGIADERPAKAH